MPLGGWALPCPLPYAVKLSPAEPAGFPAPGCPLPAPGFVPMDPSSEGLGRVFLRVLKSGVAWQDRGYSHCHWPQRRLATWESAPHIHGECLLPCSARRCAPSRRADNLALIFSVLLFPPLSSTVFSFSFSYPIFLKCPFSPLVCVKHLKARKLKPTGPPGRTCMG